MVLVVCLENAGFVLGASAYAIVCTENVFKLIDVLENVDAYPSIEASGFKNPEILAVVAASAYFKQ